MKQYRCAITYGTFDLFHIGHLRLLERISEMAERVVVAVSSDEFNAVKGKKCTIPYENPQDSLHTNLNELLLQPVGDAPPILEKYTWKKCAERLLESLKEVDK